MNRGTAAACFVLGATAIYCASAPPPPPGQPLPGLDATQLAQFERGRLAFERAFTPETGLGPTFNAGACAECHEDPASGGVGEEVETHASAFAADGLFCDPLAGQGGPVIQERVTPVLMAALGITSEPLPPGMIGTARRTSPDLFGFGLLDAVPDSTILAMADPEDADGDGVSGRPNRFFDGRIGRFGRKGLVPSLREFTQGAFIIEQGITSPALPTEETVGGLPIPPGADPVADPEIDQETLEATAAFVQFLAPPAPLKLESAGLRGRDVFAEIGCVACHVPELRTGSHPVNALSNRVVPAYTDLLLHDMGPELADICLGSATPAEFRTEPLMGLRLSAALSEGEPRFLHDGRARSIEKAIELHAGEATGARDAYLRLSDRDRAALLEFLRSL